MAESTCLILHRKSANEPYVKEAVKHVRAQGIDLRVRIPWNKKDKSVVVQEALDAGATRIIAGGGDGTLNGVANSLVGDGSSPAAAEMGVLPLGTANDFARGCGLPLNDLNRCLEIACTGEAKLIDVGRANDEVFINVTSGGFGAEVTATTPQNLKKALGGGAYTLMGLIKAFGLQPYESRVTAPGLGTVEGKWLVMAVGNNRLAGGGFEVAPEARMDDGLLDLSAVVAVEESGLSKLTAELKDPTNPDNEVLFYRQVPEFTIESTTKVQFNLDGEPLRKKRVKFSVLPSHLPVVY
jgi:lipid kinase YegS